MTSVKPSSSEARNVVSSPRPSSPRYGHDQPQEPELGPHRQPVPGREQRDREDHLLRRDAAVQERPPVARLVLAQLRGIDEEPVAGGQQQPGAGAARRQPEARQVVHDQRRVGVLRPQVVAELVAQVRGGVALGEDRGRRVAVDRAVIGGEQHRHAAPLGLPQRVPERRALEPGAGEVPERGGVPGHLEQGRVLGPAVGQLVDEVEDQRGHPVLRQVGRQPLEQPVAVGGGEHLLVVHRHRSGRSAP